MKREIIELLKKEIAAERIFQNEPMSRHTTFCAGGNAEIFIEIADQKELFQIITSMVREQIPYYILGKGSNLLVSDKGYPGCMIHIGAQMQKIQVMQDTITAQAGATLAKVAQEAAQAGLTGMEFASGIPGSAGGAALMNAGAYGGEMSHIIQEIKGIDLNGKEIELHKSEMKFGYRNSIMKEKHITILEVTYSLSKGNAEDIFTKMAELNGRRKEKQPLEYPSAGSTFKRPEGHFAGKLIMDAGLSGMSIGGAQVSEKHCGFVINKGNATAKDIVDLIYEIRKRVYNHAGIMLEPEVILLGEFK